VSLRLSVVIVVSVALASFAACGDESSEPDGLCEPGENIFCRCTGGDAGTKACKASGEDFDECLVAPNTTCEDRIECSDADPPIPCLCPDGTDGSKACLRDGTGYEQCLVGQDQPCPIGSTTASSMGGSGQGGSVGMGGSGAGMTVACTHDTCETGDALSAECDSCTAAVCVNDDYCCTTKWDFLCVNLVDLECNNLCNPVVMCEHDICTEGTALVDTCDACVTAVCAVDDVCCDSVQGQWDQFCVAEVKKGTTHAACNSLCCAHSECNSGPALDATCSDCATSVCTGDAFCCSTNWDSLCVSKAVADSACSC
jgi:hypothetical protein